MPKAARARAAQVWRSSLPTHDRSRQTAAWFGHQRQNGN